MIIIYFYIIIIPHGLSLFAVFLFTCSGFCSITFTARAFIIARFTFGRFISRWVFLRTTASYTSAISRTTTMRHYIIASYFIFLSINTSCAKLRNTFDMFNSYCCPLPPITSRMIWNCAL